MLKNKSITALRQEALNKCKEKGLAEDTVAFHISEIVRNDGYSYYHDIFIYKTLIPNRDDNIDPNLNPKPNPNH